MNVKNLNPLERHIEKITLAVAAAAALYLGYTGWTNEAHVDLRGTSINPPGVEQAVTDAVARLQAEMAKPAKAPPKLDFLQVYERIENTPLDKELLAAVAPFVPFGPSVSDKQGGPSQSVPIAIPAVPAIADTKATANRGMVKDPLPPGTTVPPGGNPAKPRELTWVKVEGSFPSDQWRKNMLATGQKDVRSVPQQFQRTTFLRVMVQRQEVLTDRPFSELQLSADKWEDVAPAKAVPPMPEINLSSPVEQERKDVLAWVDERGMDVVEPAFYEVDKSQNAPAAAGSGEAAPAPVVPAPRATTPGGTRSRSGVPSGPRPLPTLPTTPSRASGGGDYNPDAATPASAAPPPPTPLPRPTAIVPPRPAATPPGRSAPARGGSLYGDPDAVDSPAAPGSAATPAAPVAASPDSGSGAPARTETMRTLLDKPTASVWFYDENVQPEHSYVYRIAIRLYNPTYRLPDFAVLADPGARDKPWIDSPWSVIPNVVKIDPNQFFFLAGGMGNQGNPNAMSIKIYRWTTGRWMTDEVNVAPGASVAVRKNMESATPLLVDTGYTVVDIKPENGGTVILLSPRGDLVTHKLRDDSPENNAKRRELDDMIRSKASSPGSTPGSGGGASPVP